MEKEAHNALLLFFWLIARNGSNFARCFCRNCAQKAASFYGANTCFLAKQKTPDHTFKNIKII